MGALSSQNRVIQCKWLISFLPVCILIANGFTSISSNVWWRDPFDGFRSVWEGGYGALPSWAKGLVDAVYGFAPWLWDLGGSFFGIVFALLPFAPFLVVVYVIDVFGSAAKTGSFKAVGLAAQGLYDTAVGIAGAIVSVISTIAQFLHFW